MYIEKLTANERDIVSDAVNDLFVDMERARHMLSRLWEDEFSCTKKSISEYEIQRVEEEIYIVNNLLFDISLHYALLMGDTDFPGYGPHMEGMNRALATRRAIAAADNLQKEERRLGSNSDRAKVLRDIRHKAMDMNDEQAAPLLEKLIAECKD